MKTRADTIQNCQKSEMPSFTHTEFNLVDNELFTLDSNLSNYYQRNNNLSHTGYTTTVFPWPSLLEGYILRLDQIWWAELGPAPWQMKGSVSKIKLSPW